MTGQVIVGAFFSSLLSGVVPLVNGEAVAIGAALLVAPEGRVLLVLVCVAGHLMSKGALYWVARRSPERLPARARAALGRVDATRSPRTLALAITSSALIAIPPLYPTTLAAGVIGVPPVRFITCAATGMLVRFSALVWGAGYFAG